MDSTNIYLINLRKRQDRLANFLNSMPNNLVSRLKIVGAIDGSTHVLSNDDKHKLRNADWDISVGKGQWACSFSHELVWRDIVEKGILNAVILEDDAVFKIQNNEEFFKMFKLMNMNVCFLGPSNHPENTKEKPHDFLDLVCPSICKMKSNLGSMSYLITLDGAKDLLQIIDTKGHYRAVDQLINDYMKHQGKWFCSAPPLFSVADFGSDITPNARVT